MQASPFRGQLGAAAGVQAFAGPEMDAVWNSTKGSTSLAMNADKSTSARAVGECIASRDVSGRVRGEGEKLTQRGEMQVKVAVFSEVGFRDVFQIDLHS